MEYRDSNPPLVAEKRTGWQRLSVARATAESAGRRMCARRRGLHARDDNHSSENQRADKRTAHGAILPLPDPESAVRGHSRTLARATDSLVSFRAVLTSVDLLSEYRWRAVRFPCPFLSRAEEVFHLWQPEP
jgi:hypothetical protein